MTALESKQKKSNKTKNIALIFYLFTVGGNNKRVIGYNSVKRCSKNNAKIRQTNKKYFLGQKKLCGRIGRHVEVD